MFFWQKEKMIGQAIEDYLHQTESCVATCREAFEVYFNEGLSKRFGELVEETSRFENMADDRRRAIEEAMYSNALIPESRGDILGMLEALDLVPNKCESVLYQVSLQSIIVPPQFVPQVRELVYKNLDCYDLLCQTMRHLFTNVKQVGTGAEQVSRKEGESDIIERGLIKAIFDTPSIDKADKILLKELMLEIGAISDRAENAADRLRIIAVKRQS
jgi:predicted phosphate transport protein (TIGR00153 family)